MDFLLVQFDFTMSLLKINKKTSLKAVTDHLYKPLYIIGGDFQWESEHKYRKEKSLEINLSKNELIRYLKKIKKNCHRSPL